MAENIRISTVDEAVAWLTARDIRSVEQLLSHPDYPKVNLSDLARLYSMVKDLERQLPGPIDGGG